MQIVVSVPHSGTRTLCAYLGLDTHQHFHHKRIPSDVADVVHVPVRHPLKVAESWARRGKAIHELIQRYAGMLEFIARADPVLHRIEDLPRLAGLADIKAGCDAVPAYQYRVMRLVVEPNRAFFDKFYAGESRPGDRQRQACGLRPSSLEKQVG